MIHQWYSPGQLKQGCVGCEGVGCVGCVGVGVGCVGVGCVGVGGGLCGLFVLCGSYV
jgi:hypothetical protein